MDDKYYVKIKTWDDMKKEYGLSLSGSIAVRYAFTSLMESFLPEDRIIEVANHDYRDKAYTWKGHSIRTWDISEEMIETNYGTIDPRLDTSIILPTKDMKITGPHYNHTKKEYWLSVDGGGYLHSDMKVHSSTAPHRTGYYKNHNCALFAKLRFERLQQK